MLYWPYMTKFRREKIAYPPAKKVPGGKGRRNFEKRLRGAISPRCNHLIEAHSRPERCGTYVIEVTEFDFEVGSNLRGHLAPPEDTFSIKYANRYWRLR